MLAVGGQRARHDLVGGVVAAHRVDGQHRFPAGCGRAAKRRCPRLSSRPAGRPGPGPAHPGRRAAPPGCPARCSADHPRGVRAGRRPPVTGGIRGARRPGQTPRTRAATVPHPSFPSAKSACLVGPLWPPRGTRPVLARRSPIAMSRYRPPSRPGETGRTGGNCRRPCLAGLSPHRMRRIENSPSRISGVTANISCAAWYSQVGRKAAQNRNLRSGQSVIKVEAVLAGQLPGAGPGEGDRWGAGVIRAISRTQRRLRRAARTTREKARDRHPAGRSVGPAGRPRDFTLTRRST